MESNQSLNSPKATAPSHSQRQQGKQYDDRREVDQNCMVIASRSRPPRFARGQREAASALALAYAAMRPSKGHALNRPAPVTRWGGLEEVAGT
jgi:hypothetical protein